MAESIHTVLLLHDGELADLLPLLDSIDVSAVERRGSISEMADLFDVSDGDSARDWDLVIATPAKLIDLPSDFAEHSRLCVAESDSRSLRTMLERVNVRSVIVRPIHPEALKQILAQVFYSGSENRQSERRAAGRPVRFRAGWRAQAAVLADLSETGCRLLAPRSLPAGRKLSVYVPLAADSRKTLTVPGTVVRVSLTEGPEEERHSIHVQFGELSDKLVLSLSEIVERLAESPVVQPARNTEERGEGRSTTVASGSEGSSLEPEAGEAQKAGAEEEVDRADVSLVELESEGKELRTAPRFVYSARIIALGEGSTRVLSAEDISCGGLRAETHPNAAVGDTLQLAIPLPGEKEPLIVKARVVRNQDGLALSFEDLHSESYARLQRQLGVLPEAESSFSEDEEPTRIIVSEKS